jgi:hypothetical protein
MTEEQLSKLKDIYSKFREADKLVVPELSENCTEEQVKEMNKSYTEYYKMICDIQHEVGLLLDSATE